MAHRLTPLAYEGAPSLAPCIAYSNAARVAIIAIRLLRSLKMSRLSQR
jgi:hypothetical protein